MTRLKGAIVARYHPIFLTHFHKPTALPSSCRSDLYGLNVDFLSHFLLLFILALNTSVLWIPCVPLYSFTTSCNLAQRETRFCGWQLSLLLLSIPLRSKLPVLATIFVVTEEYMSISDKTDSHPRIQRIVPPSKEALSRESKISKSCHQAAKSKTRLANLRE